jgi:hypothetical protein
MNERLALATYQKAYQRARVRRVNQGLAVAFGVPALFGVLVALGAPASLMVLSILPIIVGCGVAFGKPTAKDVIDEGG